MHGTSRIGTPMTNAIQQTLPCTGPVSPSQPGADTTTGPKPSFFKTFPDNHIDNRPYKALFGQGDWTCSIARFTGTMKGPMKGPDGKEIPPTNKSFEVEFCTVAHWKDGEIVEEKLFYDQVGLMRQIGLM